MLPAYKYVDYMFIGRLHQILWYLIAHLHFANHIIVPCYKGVSLKTELRFICFFFFLL